MRRYLLLEDGTSFEGRAFGSFVERSGELVFNTSFTGFYEIMTDPSYGGQIIIFNFPSMFYYDFKMDIPQSNGISTSGVVFRDGNNPSGKYFNLIDRQMKIEGIPGIHSVDTRKLVKKIRDSGNIRGIISNSDKFPDKWEEMNTKQLITQFSTKSNYSVFSGMDRKILYIDMGSKSSLLSHISKIGDLNVVNIFNMPDNFENYDMVFLSNGPGNPSDEVFYELKRKIRDNRGKIPITGVCLGHQIIGNALGIELEKMQFGHHGSNHSVGNGKMSFITSHNHNYRLSEDSMLRKGISIPQRDLNDNTPEMLHLEESAILSVQYHPEGAPGPVNSTEFFNQMESILNEVRAR